jgi:hypothetical protein
VCCALQVGHPRFGSSTLMPMALSEGAGCISQRLPYLSYAHALNSSLATDRAIPSCMPTSNAPAYRHTASNVHPVRTRWFSHALLKDVRSDSLRSTPPCGDRLLPYVAGALGVWTLMDYLGEPWGGWDVGYQAWPAVSSNCARHNIT